MKNRNKIGEIEEDLLKKIANYYTYFSEDEKVLLNEFVSQGLVVKEDGKISLTAYGEMIKVMGYKIHLRTEQFEKNLPLHNPKKNYLITAVLGLFFYYSDILYNSYCICS